MSKRQDEVPGASKKQGAVKKAVSAVGKALGGPKRAKAAAAKQGAETGQDYKRGAAERGAALRELRGEAKPKADTTKQRRVY